VQLFLLFIDTDVRKVGHEAFAESGTIFRLNPSNHLPQKRHLTSITAIRMNDYKNMYSAIIRNTEALGGKNVSHYAEKGEFHAF